jgi:hypothetical protein
MLTLAHAALAALLLAAPTFDTVLLQNGGRLVGTVVEESPTTGVTIQIPGGQLRTVAPGEVFRIEYRDGTLGVVGAKPPPPPPEPPAETSPAPPAAAPATDRQAAPPAGAEAGSPPPAPPAAAPPEPGAPPPAGPPRPPPGQVYQPIYPPPAPPPGFDRRAHLAAGRPAPFTFAFSLGWAGPGGEAETSVPMSHLFGPQLLIGMEAGLRFTQHLTGSLLLDMGFGSLASAERARCRDAGGPDCTGLSGRFGFQLRYAFTPVAPATAWVSLGTGAEAGIISFDANTTSNDITYSGWELLRLGVGYDLRTSPGLGWGPFAAIGFSRYREVQDFYGTVTLDPATTHTWVQVGVRLVINP